MKVLNLSHFPKFDQTIENSVHRIIVLGQIEIFQKLFVDVVYSGWKCVSEYARLLGRLAKSPLPTPSQEYLCLFND